MIIRYFCPFWGSEHLKPKAFIHKVIDAEYDGIEYAIAQTSNMHEVDEIWNLAQQKGLSIILQHYDTNDPNIEKQLENYELWFEKIKPYKALKINSQTGKDYFSFQENKALIAIAEKFSKESGIEVLHETHRGKFSFAAHITKQYLERIESLKITLDISHWVNVAESYLEDQQEAVSLSVSRTNHVHARVGFPEGPQITDPRAPECEEALDKHLAWWDAVVAHKSKSDKLLTITPEFGPYPYLIHLPHSFKPIANQWEINVYMMNLLKNRYSN